MGIFSRKPDPEPCAPQTVSDEKWNRLCDGVQDAMAARTEEEGIEYGGTINRIVDNAKWN